MLETWLTLSFLPKCHSTGWYDLYFHLYLKCLQSDYLIRGPWNSVAITFGTLQERDHTEFVCRMKDYIERSDFVEKTVKAVGNQFAMKEVNLEDIDSYAKGEHVKSTRLLTVEELQEAMSGTAQSA